MFTQNAYSTFHNERYDVINHVVISENTWK